MPTIPLPTVTFLTATATPWQTPDLLEQLYNHFNITSTQCSISSTPTGAPAGSGSFTITADAVAETFQINFRQATTTTCWVTIDPDGAITNAGTAGNPGVAPTGLSANAGPEVLGFSTSSTGSKAIILEWDDAIMLLLEDTATTFYRNGIHAGRILQPFFADDLSRGIDGLALLGGIPNLGAASNNWAHYSGATGSYIHINNNGAAGDWLNTIYWTNTGVVTTASIGDAYYFPPFVMQAGNTGARELGICKYLYRADILRVAKIRLEDNLGVTKYMYIGSSTSPILIPWPDATPP